MQGPGSDCNIVNNGSDCASDIEDVLHSDSSDDSSFEQAPPTVVCVHLITLVEANVHGRQASKALGVHTAKENAIKAARHTMKRRSGCYGKTGKCSKTNKKDHTATIGDEGTLLDESNECDEHQTVSLARIPLNHECDLLISDD
jgi:hypothetical protein